jgi:MIF4G domain
LAKKVRAILNKLTPQKFTTLVEQFQELPIDSEAKLSKSLELFFEHLTLDEPAFSVAYAQMCRILQLIKVPKDGEDGNPEPGTKVAFRKLLISRCQREFEKDNMEGLNKETYMAQMADPNLSDAEKKKLKEEYEAMEMKARRRSLGNIQFIGELYKLQMLTVRIMHECVMKLLKETDETSLECLCRLMTTVGQELESDTKSRIEKGADQRLRPIETYFREMIKIIEEKKTSSRVRFLMQDVVDLRANGWKKRREDARPKTVDLRAPYLIDTDFHRTAMRVAKVSGKRMDTNRLKNIVSKRENIEDIQLGPSSSKGGGYKWSSGSSGSKSSSRYEESVSSGGPPIMQNRFSALLSSGGGGESSSSWSCGPAPSYDGRTRGGYSSRSSSRPSSMVGGPPASSYIGRCSRGQSTENHRAKAIQVDT